jgi:hypothetical protein
MIHHGQSIRLPDTFGGDAQLATGSAFYLALWLAKHGVYEDQENVQQDEFPVPVGAAPSAAPTIR